MSSHGTGASRMRDSGGSREVPPSRRSEKRTRPDVDVDEPYDKGVRPRNVEELSQWLERVQRHEDLDGEEQDFPEYSSLSMLLDPDFAYVWTPACTAEFQNLILASGIIFEEQQLEDQRRKKKCPMTRRAGDAEEAARECSVPIHREGHPSPTNCSQYVVDLNSAEGDGDWRP